MAYNIVSELLHFKRIPRLVTLRHDGMCMDTAQALRDRGDLSVFPLPQSKNRFINRYGPTFPPFLQDPSDSGLSGYLGNIYLSVYTAMGTCLFWT